MPFQSEAQRRWMHANKPAMAKRWEGHTSARVGKALPIIGKISGDGIAYLSHRRAGKSPKEADRLANQGPSMCGKCGGVIGRMVGKMSPLPMIGKHCGCDGDPWANLPKGMQAKYETTHSEGAEEMSAGQADAAANSIDEGMVGGLYGELIEAHEPKGAEGPAPMRGKHSFNGVTGIDRLDQGFKDFLHTIRDEDFDDHTRTTPDIRPTLEAMNYVSSKKNLYAGKCRGCDHSQDSFVMNSHGFMVTGLRCSALRGDPMVAKDAHCDLWTGVQHASKSLPSHFIPAEALLKKADYKGKGTRTGTPGNYKYSYGDAAAISIKTDISPEELTKVVQEMVKKLGLDVKVVARESEASEKFGRQLRIRVSSPNKAWKPARALGIELNHHVRAFSAKDSYYQTRTGTGGRAMGYVVGSHIDIRVYPQLTMDSTIDKPVLKKSKPTYVQEIPGRPMRLTLKKGKPTPGSALYVEPMVAPFKGQGRLCSNCIMWVKGEDSCVIHDRGVEVTAQHICGYHVGGQPMKKWMDHKDIDYVEPQHSGLEIAPKGGTRCGNCIAFKRGKCMKVNGLDGKPAKVHRDACCALWIPKFGKSLRKGGPYIGPRGGKWADAKHTIPWKPKLPKTQLRALRAVARTSAPTVTSGEAHPRSLKALEKLGLVTSTEQYGVKLWQATKRGQALSGVPDPRHYVSKPDVKKSRDGGGPIHYHQQSSMPDFQAIYHQPEDRETKKRDRIAGENRRRSLASKNKGRFGFHGEPPEPQLRAQPDDYRPAAQYGERRLKDKAPKPRFVPPRLFARMREKLPIIRTERLTGKRGWGKD